MTGFRLAALLLALAASACATAQPAPSVLAGAAGSLAVHMGGSFTGFAVVGSAH